MDSWAVLHCSYSTPALLFRFSCSSNHPSRGVFLGGKSSVILYISTEAQSQLLFWQLICIGGKPREWTGMSGLIPTGTELSFVSPAEPALHTAPSRGNTHRPFVWVNVCGSLFNVHTKHVMHYRKIHKSHSEGHIPHAVHILLKKNTLMSKKSLGKCSCYSLLSMGLLSVKLSRRKNIEEAQNLVSQFNR